MVHGLGKSNELIARDEGLHRDFACLLFTKLTPQERPSDETVQAIIQECVDVERTFVQEALPISLIGMNAAEMELYVEFVADSLAVALDIPKIYDTPNPFDFMDFIALSSKTNFFESRVTEYAKPGVGNAVADEKVFTLDEDF